MIVEWFSNKVTMSNTVKKEIYHLPKEMFFCRPSTWLGEFLSSGWDINIAECGHLLICAAFSASEGNFPSHHTHFLYFLH